MKIILPLALAQLKMYARDRQSLFLALFFPLLLMGAFGFITSQGPSATTIGIISPAGADTTIADALKASPLFKVTPETEAGAKAALDSGDIGLALVLPTAPPDPASTTKIRLLVNAAQPLQTQQAIAVLNATLTEIGYTVRGTQPLYSLQSEDIASRNITYLDFLVPGLLAFTLMQLAISGSGFNIVEYKRKGILKRLFVTPLRPLHFIISLIGSRLIIIFVQLAVLLAIAVFVFHANVAGNPLTLAVYVALGGIMFLAMGFALGGVARTQSSVILIGNLVIFPQMFLAAVFFPLDGLPAILQTLAGLLPLSFVAHALRQVSNDGTGFLALWPDLLGILAWTVIGIVLAVRFFRWSDAADT